MNKYYLWRNCYNLFLTNKYNSFTQIAFRINNVSKLLNVFAYWRWKVNCMRKTFFFPVKPFWDLFCLRSDSIAREKQILNFECYWTRWNAVNYPWYFFVKKYFTEKNSFFLFVTYVNSLLRNPLRTPNTNSNTEL